MARSSPCKVLAVMAFIVYAPPWRPLLAQQSQAVNRGVVEIETSGSAGMSVRLVEDLANLVDDGATRRVLPVVGKGALQILSCITKSFTCSLVRRFGIFHSSKTAR